MCEFEENACSSDWKAEIYDFLGKNCLIKTAERGQCHRPENFDWIVIFYA